MKEIKITRDFFLWCMSVIYLSAFSSLYHQIPGLYGDNGILPARAVITLEADANVIQKKVKEIPSLLWLAPALGIDVPLMMDVIAILGVIMSFGCMVWGRMRDMTNFTLLWMLYFSLYQVGQTFMWFQWDILLLEAGFLTILVAPLGFLQHVVRSGPLSSLPHRPHDTVSLWLVRWLLFRFIFSSGIVKLTAMCPTYWSLTALDYHFESQCIPTPLAWYAHHLPAWLRRLGVVGTFVIELPIPFLFFIPIRSIRIFSFYTQVLFQIIIILTGNFNFFNLMTIALCLSLVDDEFLLGLIGRPPPAVTKSSSNAGLRVAKNVICVLVEMVVYGGLIYWTIHFFSLRLQPDWTVHSKIAFTSSQFQKLLTDILPVTFCIGIISLTCNILLAFYRSFTQTGVFRKLWSIIGTVFVSCVAIWIFVISLVPFTSLDVKNQRDLWPIVHEWQQAVDQYQIVNSYGLFRRMTGVGGRPELIVEGSNSLDAGWKEYHFLYKPGDISKSPTFLIPHQPRLDWQMWFAALSKYEHNPWFVSFIYRLLEGRKEVLDLLDTERLPFPVKNPPKYVRAILYKYSYTPLGSPDKQNKDWWTRRKVEEYFNSANLDGQQMVEVLKSAGIPLERTRYLRVTNLFLKKMLAKIRFYIESFKATTFVWSLLGTGLCLNFLTPILRF